MEADGAGVRDLWRSATLSDSTPLPTKSPDRTRSLALKDESQGQDKKKICCVWPRVCLKCWYTVMFKWTRTLKSLKGEKGNLNKLQTWSRYHNYNIYQYRIWMSFLCIVKTEPLLSWLCQTVAGLNDLANRCSQGQQAAFVDPAKESARSNRVERFCNLSQSRDAAIRQAHATSLDLRSQRLSFLILCSFEASLSCTDQPQRLCGSSEVLCTLLSMNWKTMNAYRSLPATRITTQSMDSKRSLDWYVLQLMNPEKRSCWIQNPLSRNHKMLLTWTWSYKPYCKGWPFFKVDMGANHYHFYGCRELLVPASEV